MPGFTLRQQSTNMDQTTGQIVLTYVLEPGTEASPQPGGASITDYDDQGTDGPSNQ